MGIRHKEEDLRKMRERRRDRWTATFSRVRSYSDQVREVVEILSVEEGGSLSGRESLFAAKLAEFQSFADDKIYQSMAKIMTSFEVGLFAGIELREYPYDNLGIERWFRGPKSHERRIHGHKHAGIRIILLNLLEARLLGTKH